MSNRIYTGPQDRQPKTISNRTCAAALLPGTFVNVNATQFTQATSVSGGRVALLANRDFYGLATDSSDPLKTAYQIGETGIAYELRPVQTYMAALAAGTYTSGQELTIGASGRLTAAATGDRVMAYFDGPNGSVLAAGDLADVVIANIYTKV
ncbi:MAG: hypothetical protein U1E60_31535 [Reyranellaceae bacterium]